MFDHPYEGTALDGAPGRARRQEALLRKLRFASVGIVCFGLQYLVLRVLAAAGQPEPLANALGFCLSAQANYALSSVFTWRDRALPMVERRFRASFNRRRWISYNGTALVALVVNLAVFTTTYVAAGALVAALCGVAAGTLVTYLVCDRLVFTRSAPHLTAEVAS